MGGVECIPADMPGRDPAHRDPGSLCVFGELCEVIVGALGLPPGVSEQRLYRSKITVTGLTCGVR